MDDDSYIRGGGSVQIDPRRLGWAAAVGVVVVLAVCSLILAVVVASGRPSGDSLRRAGVPVRVTVTSCTGITSGIGMGAEYYQCRGDYSLGGRSFAGVVHGLRAQLPQGTEMDALVIPGRPSTLSVPGAARSASGGGYMPAIVLGGLALAGAVGLVALRTRRRGRASEGGQSQAGGG